LKNRNIVIGGTSAEMAILGSHYFSAENGTVTSSAALSNPYAPKVTIDSTPFLAINYLENVVTDTHYDDPDRKGRHMVFLRECFKIMV
jgi:cyanophycinase-like exopeptidase